MRIIHHRVFSFSNMPRLAKKQTAKLVCLLAGISLLFASPVLLGDQNDPKLDELFRQLHLVKGQQVGDEITDQIWVLWRESGNPEIDALMDQGITAMREARLRSAVDIFDQIVAMAPDFAEGWNKRATVYYFLQEYEKSAADVRKTLSLEPRHFGAISGLGLIFLSLEYYKGALEAFERAVDINPHLIGPRQQIRRIKEILRNDPA